MADISFQPSAGYILVKPQQVQSKTLLYAKAEGEQTTKGEVVAVGDPMLHQSGELVVAKVNVGDMIVFNPYRVEKIHIDDAEHLIISFEAVRGVISEK